MTDETGTETEETSNGRGTLTRRSLIAALGTTGVFSAAAALSSEDSDNALASIGGGAMATTTSNLEINWLEGEFDERPDPGIERRFFYAIDEERVYRDTGSSWTEVPLGGVWDEDEEENTISPRDGQAVSVEHLESDVVATRNIARTPSDVSEGWFNDGGSTLDLDGPMLMGEDLTQWDERYPADDQEITAETDNPWRGSQSVNIHSPSSPDIVELHLPEEIDLTDYHLSAAVHFTADDTSSVNWYYMSGGEEVRRFQYNYSPNSRPEGWHRIDFSPRDTETGIENVDEIRIVGVTDDSHEFWVDDIRFTPATTNPRIALTFDNSDARVYDNAFPIMEEYGIPGTMFTDPNFLESADRMSIKETQELRESGWEIGAKPYDNDNVHGMTYEEQRENFSKVKQEMQELDLGEIKGLVYMGNNWNGDSPRAASEFFDYAFGGQTNDSRSQNPSNPTNPWGLRRGRPDTASGGKTVVDRTIEDNCVGAVYWHHVGDEDEEISTSEFEDLLDYIDKSEVEPVRASELFDNI